MACIFSVKLEYLPHIYVGEFSHHSLLFSGSIDCDDSKTRVIVPVDYIFDFASQGFN